MKKKYIPARLELSVAEQMLTSPTHIRSQPIPRIAYSSRVLNVDSSFQKYPVLKCLRNSKIHIMSNDFLSQVTLNNLMSGLNL